MPYSFDDVIVLQHGACVCSAAPASPSWTNSTSTSDVAFKLPATELAHADHREAHCGLDDRGAASRHTAASAAGSRPTAGMSAVRAGRAPRLVARRFQRRSACASCSGTADHDA
jgi:hypothetical protein